MATLNELMEFDHPVFIDADSTIHTENILAPFAPELFGVDDSELQAQAHNAGWELLTGYTGQYGYNGPVMHPSEYVGGGLERDILANPGWYVVTAVVDDEGYEPYGWAVAYLPADH